jgi:hypothetical protein
MHSHKDSAALDATANAPQFLRHVWIGSLKIPHSAPDNQIKGINTRKKRNSHSE